MAMSPWVPDPCPAQARRIGKSSEEVNELGAVLARKQSQMIEWEGLVAKGDGHG